MTFRFSLTLGEHLFDYEPRDVNSVNSVWLEIFVVSFLIGRLLATTGLDWFIRNAAFFCQVGESERGVRLKDFDWYCYAT